MLKRICSFDESADSLEVLKEAIALFLSKWYSLVSLEPVQISSINYGKNKWSFGAEVYSKSFYSHLLYRWDKSPGSFDILISNSGKVIFMRSTFIPQLSVPEDPIISEKEAKYKISGYKYTVFHWGGFEERVLSIKDIKKSALEVFIHSVAENIKVIRLGYHLAWRFNTFDGDFFVDSQTGEVIDFIQGWVSI